MKNFIIVLILLFSNLVSCNTENNDGTYYLTFEEKPYLQKDEVFSKGFKIGNILSQQLEKNNLVTIKIKIDEHYKELIKTNTIFYISEGRLEYDTVGDEGKVITSDSKLFGFNNKTSMYLYKAKKLGKKFYDSSMSKAKEFYNNTQ